MGKNEDFSDVLELNDAFVSWVILFACFVGLPLFFENFLFVSVGVGFSASEADEKRRIFTIIYGLPRIYLSVVLLFQRQIIVE